MLNFPRNPSKSQFDKGENKPLHSMALIPRLEPAVVRILIDNQSYHQPVGAGFLVSPQHVLTCAHVITAALSIPQNTATLPTELISLDFPFLPQHPRCQAQVIRWCPVNPEVIVGELEDIAVLELLAEPPPAAQPVQLVKLVSYFDRGVRLCGFPAGKEMGMYVNAKLQSVTGRGYIQLNTDLGHGQVAPGFSGTAVWDKQENGIVGMVVSIDDYQGDVPAYLIPASSLIQAYPELDVHSRPPNPYRGLAAFREADANLFFGREAVVAELAATVEKQSFVAVIGASGSGKSSVVFAGLVPCLRQTGHWLITSLRPRTQPFLELATALVPWLYPDKLDQAKKLEEFSRDLQNSQITLSSILQLIQREYPNQRLLLIIDQFEELYTHTADKTLQQRFIDVLLQPLPSPYCVPLITLRADFMGQALAHDTFANVLDQYRDKKLGRMTDSELTGAIEQPANQLGVKLAAGLTDHILGELGREPGNLPLLEFTLTQLWEQQQYRQLTHEAYQAMGGVHQALAHYADGIYQQFTSAEQEQMRRVLVQLVRPGEGTEDTRQVAMLAQLPTEYRPLVVQLANQRLVVTGQDEQERETVEVVHEALIRHWQPLREWLSEDRSFRLWQNDLRRNLASWEQTEKDEGALLRGARLAEAQEKLQARQAELSIPEQAYIQASIAFRAQEINRKKQLQRRIIGGLVSFLIIVLVLAGIAGWQRWQAEQRTTEALRNQSYALAALAKIEMDKGDTTTGILLALEALPKSIAQPDRPYVGEAMEQLGHGLIQKRERFIFQHEGIVNHVALSPDGKYIVTASNDYTARLWEIPTGQLHHTFQGHEKWVGYVAFSPDGYQVVTTSHDNTARLWDTNSGQLSHILRGHDKMVNYAAFSPDGQQIVTASKDGTARLWDAHSGELRHIFKHDKEKDVTYVTFSLDGQQIFTASRDKTARLWNAHSGRQDYTLTGHQASIIHAAFSPNGQRIATASTDNTVKLWNAHNGQWLLTLENSKHYVQGHKSNINHVAFSPDSQKIVTASADFTAKIWDAHSGQVLYSLNGHENYVNQATFSADGQRIITASADNTVKLWDVNSGQLLLTLKGHENPVNQAAFGTDSQQIITASADGTVRLWETNSKPIYHILKQKYENDVTYAAVSPNGQQVVTASRNDTNTAKLWQVGDNHPFATLGHEQRVVRATFSTNGQQIVTTSTDYTAKIWDVYSGQLIKTLTGHGNTINHAAFSPDGQQIVTASADKTAKVWDVDNGKWFKSFEHASYVNSAVFSPNGQQIVTASADFIAKLWDIKSGQELQSFKGHENYVNYAAFSPDGQQIVTASADSTAKLWDIQSGQELQTFKGHESYVNYATFSPNGQQIVTASADGTARLWNIDNNQSVLILRRGESAVTYAAFTPDGQQIVIACNDGTAQLWDISLQTWPDFARQSVPRRLSTKQREQFGLSLLPEQVLSDQLVVEGEQLARQGKVTEAVAKFTEAKAKDADLKLDPVMKARILAMPKLLADGKQLAEKGDIPAATAKFQQATEWGYQFGIKPEERAKQIAAMKKESNQHNNKAR